MRLLPKETGVRPIVNLRRRVEKVRIILFLLRLGSEIDDGLDGAGPIQAISVDQSNPSGGIPDPVVRKGAFCVLG